MTNSEITDEQIYRFIFDKIESVPHLETLLLLWNSRPKKWAEEELVARLFINTESLREIVQNLERNQLAAPETTDTTRFYSYNTVSENTDNLIAAVAATYRRDLIRVSRAIHSKSSSGAREFGRAFKFNKGTD